MADNLDIVTKGIVELVRKKNEAYGHAFEDDLNDYGLVAASIQIGHKAKRLKNLLTNDIPDNGESVIDSITDLVGYGLLTLEWASRHNNELK